MKNLLGNSDAISGGSLVSSDFEFEVPLGDTDTPAFPTQFEITDRGIVIVPQHFSRAYFYDGDIVLPLGYDSVPSPPMGLGPEKDHNNDKPNRHGYIYSNAERGPSVCTSLSRGRIGTITRFNEEDKLITGSWSAATQWIDHFGNLSPVSGRSNEIRFETQSLHRPETDKGKLRDDRDRRGDDLLKAVVWEGVDKGPSGTIGRRLYRTKDTINSGDGDIYFLTGNVGYAGISAFATVPDNMSTHFADNVPDGWLVAPAETGIIPVPSFKLCRFSMGRLWVANTQADPGAIHPSLPNRYGTFLGREGIRPDPSAGEITGLWNVGGGLLAFTGSSSFLIQPNAEGVGFRAATLSSTIGCVAPSSIASLPDGSVIWLGKEGFYQYTGAGVELISGPIEKLIRRISKSRALQSVAAFIPESHEYRCWVPMDGSETNDLCLIYDGEGWRRRTNEHVSCICVTKDHRKYAIAGGQVYSGLGFTDTWDPRIHDPTGAPIFSPVADPKGEVYNGFFVLDRENRADWKSGTGTVVTAGSSAQNDTVETEEVTIPATFVQRQYVFETSWIEWQRSQGRRSAKTIYLSTVESHSGKALVQVYRDWRKEKAIYEDSVALHSTEDIPDFWGEGTLPEEFTIADRKRNGEEIPVWSRNRPLWRRIDMSVPSCEVYKIRITSSNPFEVIGLSLDEEVKPGPTARIP